MKCQKSLWLHFNMPDERDEICESQQNVFNTGYEVGAFARELFPGGIDASKGQHEKVTEAVAYTKELIDSGQTVIYEAAFSDGETLCYIDILVKENGRWHAFEVKATSKVKDYHILDAAFQYYVITKAGLPLEDISLVHLNTSYIRRGVIDEQQLFSKVCMNDIILPMQGTIPVNLLALNQMLDAGLMPEIDMGAHCTNPFICDFIEFCSRGIAVEPENTDSRPASRNQQALDDFKSRLKYPLYFMDFETIMPAVPYHDESRPYQQLPFQYSLHVARNPETMRQPEHFEFLGTPPEDPRPAFIESLLDHLGDNGTIIVWNETFEKTRLRELARDFPQYAHRINALFDRLEDLMVPFRKQHFYTPEMNGSYSLKYVLPALINDISYDDLEIREGGPASLTYDSLYYDIDSESITRKREDLLKYCELDTLSLVRILELL